MKISIFGLGYVGVVSGACLAKLGHEVIGVDTNADKVRLLNSGVSPIVEDGIAELIREMVEQGQMRGTCEATEAVEATEISFVSVGTPSARNGSLNLDAVKRVTESIGTILSTKKAPHTVVYRSTILPGTTEADLIPALLELSGRSLGEGIDVCFNPEFLREATSIEDFNHPPYTIIGSATERGFKVMEEVYASLDARVFKTELKVAESVKYMSNLYHALKICFANEMGTVFGHLGMDSREVAEIFCEDTELNISKSYLRPGYAFGGSCLPKDLRAFLSLANSIDMDLPMLSSILTSNQRHVERAFEMITSHGRQTIALFGLSFKSGTDDLRESPLVALAERLIGRGYEIKIYDPYVKMAQLVGANKQYIEAEIPHIERLIQSDVSSTLADAGVIVIGHAADAAVKEIATVDAAVPIIDLQGISELEKTRGETYQGICW